MIVSGSFVDMSTGKPIPNVAINFYPDGDTTKDPFTVYSSDANGAYTMNQALFDTESNPTLVAKATGYNDAIGGPQVFNAQVPMSESTADTVTDKTWIVWLILALVVGYLIWKFKLLEKIK